ncbi:MAG: septum formation initiator family protein [Candidatus Paceibacterota bacterium]|jgi:cell division protein FtsB
MANFQRKNKYKNVLYSKVSIVILGLLTLFLLVGVISMIRKTREAYINKEVTKEKLAELKDQKGLLENETAKLKTEEGVEESIREKFRVVKDGEGLVVITDEKPKKEEIDSSRKDGGFWQFIKNIFN